MARDFGTKKKILLVWRISYNFPVIVISVKILLVQICEDIIPLNRWEQMKSVVAATNVDQWIWFEKKEQKTFMWMQSFYSRICSWLLSTLSSRSIQPVLRPADRARDKLVCVRPRATFFIIWLIAGASSIGLWQTHFNNTDNKPTGYPIWYW